MPLWHKDDFEPKASEKEQTQDELSALLLSANTGSKSPLGRCPRHPCPRKRRVTLTCHQTWGKHQDESAYSNLTQ